MGHRQAMAMKDLERLADEEQVYEQQLKDIQKRQAMQLTLNDYNAKIAAFEEELEASKKFQKRAAKAKERPAGWTF